MIPLTVALERNPNRNGDWTYRMFIPDEWVL